LKSRGFNFEETHLTHPERIGKLLALLALGSAWTYRTGQALAEQTPIPLKKTLQRPLKSIFRHGLDFIRHTVLNLPDRHAEFLWLLGFLSCT
jgi:hypothetical protein